MNHLRELGDQHRHPLPVGRAAIVAGRIAVARGEHDLAIAEFERAIELLSNVEFPLETARAKRELARVLARRQPEVAIAEARAALGTFERLGAAVDADATASLLRSLGAPARSGPRKAGVLTERERQVLELIGHGLSNPEIANRLYISRKTASHHVSNVLAKLGLPNRAAAAAHAARRGGLPHCPRLCRHDRARRHLPARRDLDRLLDRAALRGAGHARRLPGAAGPAPAVREGRVDRADVAGGHAVMAHAGHH